MVETKPPKCATCKYYIKEKTETAGTCTLSGARYGHSKVACTAYEEGRKGRINYRIDIHTNCYHPKTGREFIISKGEWNKINNLVKEVCKKEIEWSFICVAPYKGRNRHYIYTLDIGNNKELYVEMFHLKDGRHSEMIDYRVGELKC